MNKKYKRGISPVIATVLLIVIAIALFLLIFLWLRGFQREVVTKQGTPIETVCQEVSFDLTKTDYTVQIMNTGSIPIYKVKIYITDDGTELAAEDGGNIAPGSVVSISPVNCGAGEYVKVIPVLLGTTQGGAKREHDCENQAQTIPC